LRLVLKEEEAHRMPDPISRRDLLRATAAAMALPAMSAASINQSPRDSGLIRRENERPGTRGWIADRVVIDPATKWRSRAIEGFCSRTSLRAGESLTVHVSTDPPSPFVIDLYRLGYYQGHGARFIERLGPFAGSKQPDPAVGSMRRRECVWEPCVTLAIPDAWVSGVYLGKMTAEEGGAQSYVVFIVRDDRACDYLFQCSDTTWNAYNRWPDQYSLYDDGAEQWYWGPDVAVSFDRPYARYCQILDAPLSTGSGEFLLWEFPLAFWMEEQGYDVSYISNLDTHADPANLRRARGFLSVGHDEYWTLAMFEQMKAAVADGLNVAFLSGNSVCGVIDLLPSADGRPDRVLTRVGRYGGPSKGELEGGFAEMGRFRRNGPNEATLIGARSTYPISGGSDWTCVRPEHWLFDGTGMKAGDSIPGLVGWEWHGDPAPIPGLEIVASGPTRPAPDAPPTGTYTATIYPGPKGNFVFNASTIWWGDGLAEPPGYLRPSVYTTPRGPDPRVRRITANLLDRMRA
jgi:hypothetical protein